MGKGFYLLSSFCLSVKIGDCYDSIHLKPTFDTRMRHGKSWSSHGNDRFQFDIVNDRTEEHRTCAEVLEAVDHWRAHGLEVQLSASYVELFGSEALHWCWLGCWHTAASLFRN